MRVLSLAALLVASTASAAVEQVVDNPFPMAAYRIQVRDGFPQPDWNWLHWRLPGPQGDLTVEVASPGSDWLRVILTPRVSRVALRVMRCSEDGPMLVVVRGPGSDESVAVPSCVDGRWIVAESPPGGSIRELQVEGIHAIDDLFVELGSTPQAPELVLSATASGDSAFAFLVQSLAGTDAPHARLSLFLPPELWGTTTPADAGGLLFAPTAVGVEGASVAISTTAPAPACDQTQSIVGVLRDDGELDVSDNVAIAVRRGDPSRVAVREVCNREGDEDCDGFEGCADADCENRGICGAGVTTEDIYNGNLPQRPFAFPLDPSQPVPQPAPAPSSCMPLGYAVPAYCCRTLSPSPDDTLLALIERNCPMKALGLAASPRVNAKGIGLIQRGDTTIRYSVAYSNREVTSLKNVVVVDVLPPELDEATLVVDADGRYDPLTRAIVWSGPELRPGDWREVGFSARVHDGLPIGTRVTNQATIIFPEAFVRFETSTIEHVIASPTLSLTPLLFVATCDPGPRPNTWRPRLTNWGLSNAHAATVRPFRAPEGTVFEARTVTGFFHPDDERQVGTVVPFAATPTEESLVIVAHDGRDPCGSITWEIAWRDEDGTRQRRRVTAFRPDAPESSGCRIAPGSRHRAAPLLLGVLTLLGFLGRRRRA